MATRNAVVRTLLAMMKTGGRHCYSMNAQLVPHYYDVWLSEITGTANELERRNRSGSAHPIRSRPVKPRILEKYYSGRRALVVWILDEPSAGWLILYMLLNPPEND